MWRVGLISPNAAVSIRGRRSQKFGSEVPSGVGTAGSGFEVALVSVGFLLVAEGDGGFNVPRSVFGGVGYVTGVVVDETLLEVLGDSGVVVLPGGDVA